MLQKVLTILLLIFAGACATAGDQTRAVLQSPPDIPPQAEIKTVPFVKQTRGYCGPSTLTMAMQWAGRNVTIDEIAPEVYTAGKKGSLQMDLITASRRHGLLAVPVEGMANMLREVAAGHPVIVLENLGFSWFPQWHYSIVTGYDLKEQEVIMHSGTTANKRQSLNYFERGWKLGGYWGLVVLPAHELSTTAGELEHLQAAVGLEQAHWPREAETAYRNILKRWPGSLAALIGLGNIAYQDKKFGAAVSYLKQASRLHPDSAVARHNLAVAQMAALDQIKP